MSGNSNYFPASSEVKETFNPSENFRGEPRPEHHIHRESEPLEANDSLSNDRFQSNDSDVREPRRDIGVTGVHQGTPDFQDPLSKQNAYSERPLDVQPIDQGVAIDGRRDHLPEGHANVSDKIVGKMQKATGKYMNKPELVEKGELRETGGKLAVTGETRPPNV